MNKRAFAKAIATANPGLYVRWIAVTGEFRIAASWLSAVRPSPGLNSERELSAYYTTDEDDAAVTARNMWERKYLRSPAD